MTKDNCIYLQFLQPCSMFILAHKKMKVKLGLGLRLITIIWREIHELRFGKSPVIVMRRRSRIYCSIDASNAVIRSSHHSPHDFRLTKVQAAPLFPWGRWSGGSENIFISGHGQRERTALLWTGAGSTSQRR